MSLEVDRKVRLWAQHGQTLMLAVITATVGFAAKTTWDSNTLQATLVARIDILTLQITELKQQQTQYITRPEFAAHEAYIHQRLQAVEGRAK